MVLGHYHDPSSSSDTIELDSIRKNSRSEGRRFIGTTTNITTRWSETEEGGRGERR